MILLLDERQRKELAQYSPYIAIPKVSSQNRRYIPMDYLVTPEKIYKVTDNRDENK